MKEARPLLHLRARVWVLSIAVKEVDDDGELRRSVGYERWENLITSMAPGLKTELKDRQPLDIWEVDLFLFLSLYFYI